MADKRERGCSGGRAEAAETRAAGAGAAETKATETRTAGTGGAETGDGGMTGSFRPDEEKAGHYHPVLLPGILEVDKLYTVHYFEYMNDFSFPGESHDFWEFLCVDKGEVIVQAGDRRLTLGKDEIVFHQPNEFHTVQSNGVTAPNLVVISFSCASGAMDFFRGKVLTIGEGERELLALILREAMECFRTPLDDPYTQAMELAERPPFGGTQMLRLLLEQLLIRLIRVHSSSALVSDTAPLKQKADAGVYERVLAYLEEHLDRQLSIEQICRDTLVGLSQLQKLFRERHGCGIIDYFSHMKIRAAKQLIRNQRLNFTQIADSLGYTSVHYFSRQFKKITGMTPSEYSSSIKKLSEAPVRLK